MILLGDTHLGIKKFDTKTFEAHVSFIKDVVNYAKEKNKAIFQLGDLFDNRYMCDIAFLNNVFDLFEFIQSKGVKFYSLLGNHDIYYREKRDISLSRILAKHFNNFVLYDKQSILEYKGKKIFIVAWLCRDDVLDTSLLENADYVFGHLEINGFEIIKGHFSENHKLNNEDFKIPVFSGHYHLKNKNNNVYYIGTPYQLTWGDFDTQKGFYDFDVENNKIKFIENKKTAQHLEIHYNGNLEKPIQILGHYDINKKLSFDLASFKEKLGIIKNNKNKFIIHTNDSLYEEYLFLMRENNIEFEIVNRFRIQEIELNDTKIHSTKEIIFSFLSETHKHFIPEIEEMIKECE